MRATLTDVRLNRDLRPYQVSALKKLDEAFDAQPRNRAWLVLPPGTGKTLVGLEAVRRLGQPAVVFGPNTAIQGQWIKEWRKSFSNPSADAVAGATRDLKSPVNVLTYQSLATFDPDAEVTESGEEVGHTQRLRPQGRELIEAIKSKGPVTLVLDECHHLLDTWGELVAEVIRDLPDATVVGLTATPPAQLTRTEAKLVDELFGEPSLGPSIPAVVRGGYLAPFAELAWITKPTTAESEWLATEAERFAELTTDLLDPKFADTPFLTWLDQRIVYRGDGNVSWQRFERDNPELAAAALRFHHHGLLELPQGARLREEHRHEPSAGDWVCLLDDYIERCLRPSDNKHALEAIRHALPSVGYSLTKRGVRGGRSPIDRVLARSVAKTQAVPEILRAEAAALGEQMRALVICDHERATATLPARLDGVIDAQAGSARLVLDGLIADPRTAGLAPMMVTGRTVATDADTGKRFAEFCIELDPSLELDPIEQPDGDDGTASVEITGRWSSRRWVGLVTRFFESGGTRALIGTRGMLGEGWNARTVNTLIDLSEATTATSVVQTRGRALRLDPAWPEKAAHNWSVVCVAPGHPRGNVDWDRFVRKHDAYFAVTADGDIMAGVAHVDPELSPFAPPSSDSFDRLNAGMLQRVERRDDVRTMWDVGVEYADSLVHTVVIRKDVVRTPPPPEVVAQTHQPPEAVPAEVGVHPAVSSSAALVAAVGLVVGVLLALAHVGVGIAVGGLTAWLAHIAQRTHRAWRAVQQTPEEPDLVAMGCALADGLKAAELVSRESDAVAVAVDEDGTYRVELSGVPEAESAVFATAMDELISPIGDPRYLLPRYVVTNRTWKDAVARAFNRPIVNEVVYHAVPSILGENRKRAGHLAEAWSRWVSEASAIYTRTPEGAGILAGYAGVSPTDTTAALRARWS